jgi:MFS family permease
LAELTTRVPRAARVTTSIVFVLHAALFASWTPHIPLVKERLGLDTGGLGLALLGAPLGSMIALALVGGLIARWGSRRGVLVLLIANALAAPLLGLAWHPVALFVALAILGGCQGGLDVAMNSQGVEVERAYGKSILVSFHAFWSLGAFAGAALGSLAIRLGVGLTAQMVGFGAVIVAAAWFLTRPMFPDASTAGEHHFAAPWRDLRVLLLGGLMFAGLLCEGAVGDWAAVYLREDLAVPAASAGLGYAVFAIMMMVGRALGDRWVARYGPVRVVAVTAAIGGVGLAFGLLVGRPWAALIGFGAFGLGIACIVPIIFSVAATRSAAHAGQAIAGASTVGWTGFLLGPPLIGFLAHGTSLPLALAVLPALSFVIVVGSRALR